MITAEEHAAAEGLTVVNPTSFELLSALTGDPIVVGTTTGESVLLRLSTVDEFIEGNAAARNSLIAQGASVPPPVTREDAERLVAPLRRPGVVR